MDELGEGDFVARTQFVNGDQIVEARSNDRWWRQVVTGRS